MQSPACTGAISALLLPRSPEQLQPAAGACVHFAEHIECAGVHSVYNCLLSCWHVVVKGKVRCLPA